MTAMGGHQSHRVDTVRWLTPPHVLDALGPFDLDPCGAPGWPTATTVYLPENGQDGLALPWAGLVFLNPPYGSQAWAWLARAADHAQAGGNVIALTFARTETAGFVSEVWGKADAVRFLHGRLHFHHADGTRAAANSGAPSVLVAYGPRAVDRLATAATLPGTFLRIPRCPLPSPTSEVRDAAA